jgi:CBS domain-containing protein
MSAGRNESKGESTRESLRAFATRDLVVIPWDESLENAYLMMARHRVRHLPVVYEGKIIGIISDRDLQRAMLVDKSDILAERASLPEFDSKARIRDYMGWPVEAIDESRSIKDAAREMIDKKISALIVTKGSKVSGIVTTEDLLRALVDERESSENRERGHDGSLQEVKDRMQSALYNSPIGQVAHALANAGV